MISQAQRLKHHRISAWKALKQARQKMSQIKYKNAQNRYQLRSIIIQKNKILFILSEMQMELRQHPLTSSHSHTIPHKKTIFGQKRPNTYNSYRQTLFISSMYYISFVYFGYIMMYFNSIDFSQIMHVFQIFMSRDFAQGLYSGLPALGACFGSFLSKYFIEKYSRSQNFVYCNTISIFAGILVLIPNMNTLLIGRLIQGACVGFFCSITPMTVKQISPIQLSGTMNGVNNVAISIGYFLGYILGWISNNFLSKDDYNYILPFAAGFIISFIQLIWIKVIFPYETPKYLILNKRIEDARKVIEIIYLAQYRERILMEKMMEVNFTQVQQQLVKSFEQINQEPILEKQAQKKPTVLASFSSCFLVVAQQMTGFNVFLLFGSEIAKQYLPNMPVSLSMIISIEKLLITTMASFFLFNLFGRKRLLVLGSLLCTLALYSVVYGGYKIKYEEPGGQVYIFLGIFVCIFSVAATQGPLTWVYISQVLQPKAIPLIVFMKWMANFLSVVTFPILRSYSDQKSCVEIFLVYFLFTFMATIIFQYTLVETKDKNQVQIYEEIQKKEQYIQRFFCKCIWWRNHQYRINTHWNHD